MGRQSVERSLGGRGERGGGGRGEEGWWCLGISSLMSCRVCRNPACSPQASWRRVQAWVPAEGSLVPACRSKSPLCVYLCVGEAVAQLPWAPAQSFEDKMVIQSPFRYVANQWSLCDTHASLCWSLQLKHLWSSVKRVWPVAAWLQVELDYEWLTKLQIICLGYFSFFFPQFHADNAEFCCGWYSMSIWFSSNDKNGSVFSWNTWYGLFFLLLLGNKLSSLTSADFSAISALLLFIMTAF